jgi:hypothetical protein
LDSEVFVEGNYTNIDLTLIPLSAPALHPLIIAQAGHQLPINPAMMTAAPNVLCLQSLIGL